MGGAVWKPTWLLRDEFITAQDAPLTDPRTCEPGPGQLDIADANNLLSVTSGTLKLIGDGAQTGKADENAGYTRATGLAFATKVSQVGANAVIGWSNAKADYSKTHGVTPNCGIMTTDGSFSANSNNFSTPDIVMVLRSTGCYTLAKEGGIWYTVWVHTNSTISTMYAGANNGNIGFLALDYMRVSQLPAPWTDDFCLATQRLAGARANGDTFTHTADCILDFVVATLPSDAIDFRFRVQDATNYWQLTINSAGNMELNEVVSGSATSRGTSAGTIANGDNVRILARGQNIRVYEGGAGLPVNLRITHATAANFATATAGVLTSEGTDGAITDIISWMGAPTNVTELEKIINPT